MKLGNTNLLRVIGAGVVSAALCGSAMGQGSGGFDKPLKNKAKEAQPESDSRSTMRMREDDGENSYELVINGDEVTARVNGKEVPAERIVREKDKVQILDKNGKVVKTFEVSTNPFGQGEGRAPRARTGGGRLRLTQPPEAAPETPAPMAHPKVMVGINMDQAGDEDLKGTGLKDGTEAIVIKRVIPDLPAEKAGIQEGDIITEIDGDRPATQEHLHDVLMGKKPGDTVTFTVRRKGADKTIRVELEKYDAKKLPLATTTPQEFPGMDEHMKEMLKGFGNQGGNTWVVPGPDGTPNWQVFRGPGGQSEERLAELDKKMSDLDEKLNRLTEQMTKLEKLVERLDKRKE